MPLPRWYVNVWNPDGSSRWGKEGTQTRITRAGLRMRLTAELDCGPASFTAVGALSDIPILSVVQVMAEFGGVLTPLYCGEVQRGGNRLDRAGQEYQLASLLGRLGEVTLSDTFTAPAQAAHLTLRAMIQDVINSGQLGTPSLILYDAAMIPDLGFNAKAITDAQGEYVLDVLKRLDQQGAQSNPVVKLAYGVRPDRKFFCRPASTASLAISKAQARQKPVPTNGVGTVTRVLWFVAKRPNGSWVKHLSKRVPGTDPYGARTQRRYVPQTVDPWRVPTPTYSLWQFNANRPAGAAPYSPHPLQPQPSAQDAARLADRDASPLTAPLFNLTGQYIAAQVATPEPFERLVFAAGMLGFNSNGVTGAPTLFAVAGGGVNDNIPYDGAEGGQGFTAGTLYLKTPASSAYLYNPTASNDAVGQGLTLAELRPETLNRALLDQLAQPHYRTPAEDPSELTLGTPLKPADLKPNVTYDGQGARPAEWEYTLTGDTDLTLTAFLGQFAPPDALAQAALIRAGDTNATVNALTAQT